MKRYICLLLILLLLTTAFGLNTFADNGTNEIKYSYYNTEPDSSAVYVFDVSYGKSTCTDENFYEIIVLQNSAITAYFCYRSRCNYRWIRPEPSPPASFSTSATVTIL